MQKSTPEKWTGELLAKMHINNVTSRELAKELDVTEQYVSMLMHSHKTTKNAKQRLNAAYQAVLQKRKGA